MSCADLADDLVGERRRGRRRTAARRRRPARPSQVEQRHVGAVVRGLLELLHDRVRRARRPPAHRDLSSMVSVMSLRMRPNDAALVISRVVPSVVVIVQRYSAWVWAETITLIDGSSRSAIASDVAAGEVAGAAVQRRRRRPGSRPGGSTRTLVFDALASASLLRPPCWRRRPRRRRSGRRRRSASRWSASSFRTSPMNPTSNFWPLSLRNALDAVRREQRLAGGVDARRSPTGTGSRRRGSVFVVLPLAMA